MKEKNEGDMRRLEAAINKGVTKHQAQNEMAGAGSVKAGKKKVKKSR